VTAPPASDTESFGPYLGVEKARLVRGGLLRVWPLHLAGTGLSNADRSMAEARGIGPSDVQGHLEGIRQVLRREPEAVARVGAHLVEARSRACRTLAFETAERIQLELAALEWVSGPQRVAGCRSPDRSVHGWSGGLLLTLEIRGGRLDGWASTAIDAGRGQALSRTTQKAWRDLTARNADLGAALAQVHRIG